MIQSFIKILFYDIPSTSNLSKYDRPDLIKALSQEKKLKNWYIQEYTTGTTFEPNIIKKSDNDNGGKLDITKTQATVLQYHRINSLNDR